MARAAACVGSTRAPRPLHRQTAIQGALSRAWQQVHCSCRRAAGSLKFRAECLSVAAQPEGPAYVRRTMVA